MQKVHTKNYSTENKTYARQTPFSAIFILNKIMAPILLIIHIQNKTLDLCISGQQRS